MNQIIIDAIKNKKLIEYTYGGGNRKGEPHCFGVGKTGNGLLRIFQTSGASKSGNSTGWKLLKTEEIENIKLTNEIFRHPREGYNPNDSAMGRIIARL